MKNSSDLDMGRRPELKSDEFFVSTPIIIEILSCEHLFTAGKVLPFIGASVRDVISFIITFTRGGHYVRLRGLRPLRLYYNTSRYSRMGCCFSRSQWILLSGTARSDFSMSQCGCLKPNPAHGRWWVGSALRYQHNMDRS